MCEFYSHQNDKMVNDKMVNDKMNCLDLEPREVFSEFYEITRIPRPSKHEEKIGAYLAEWAKKHNLEYQTDKAGNVVIRKPASNGYENKPGVILQAHQDMVCEKNGDVQHNFMTDPIETWVDGDWLKARGTTLGADDGIGIAMALAILASEKLKHPALECLFTVDEETGLTGAFALQEGMLHGSTLINLDSEDDGEAFIGCAGGIDTVARFAAEYQPASSDSFAAKISVKGLIGGHSGDDIDKGRGNANKILVRFLYQLSSSTHLQLAFIHGGNLRNAIAREAEATVVVPFEYKEQLRIDFNIFLAAIQNELCNPEKELQMQLESAEIPNRVFSDNLTQRLIRALYACPHGVIRMSQDMKGLVETSTNLASIKETDNGIVIATSQRSSVESAKHDIKDMVSAVFELAGAEVTHGEGYPGWKPDTKSHILDITVEAYKKLFNAEPKVRAIHAGLECGLFLEKYPYLDMVSIGPGMVGVHSPQEKLNIPSTQRCWQWLKEILSSL